jgi:hypothetical protein
MPYELSHLNALWDALGKTTVRDEDGDVVTDEPFCISRRVPSSISGHGLNPCTTGSSLP